MTEKKEEHPAAMNAFELISMSKGLNLENLFGTEQVCTLPIMNVQYCLFSCYSVSQRKLIMRGHFPRHLREPTAFYKLICLMLLKEENKTF